MAGIDVLSTCHCCGLIQRIGPMAPRTIARCPRCRTLVRQVRVARSRARTVAFALAALALYPAAMTLPVLEVSRLGHIHEATIWSGVIALLAEGQMFVGLIVLFASIIAPVAKLVALLAICLPLARREHRAFAYRFVEWIGRWGMLDVLLVAILVAVVKLGDWVQVQPGPGLAAFAGVVVFSLIASAVFDPHSIWEDHR
jgi:paraquat-inducible protein A